MTEVDTTCMAKHSFYPKLRHWYIFTPGTFICTHPQIDEHGTSTYFYIEMKNHLVLFLFFYF